MPSLIDEIATHTGKSAAEIRKMGADGKLSIQMLVDALGGRYEAIMKKVADMPTTVRDALTNVGNAFGEYVGKHNEANQITATLAASVEILGKNIDTVLNYALVAGAGALISYTGGMAKAAAQTAYKGMQSSRAAAQELMLARAQAAQTAATLAQVQALATLTPAHAQVTAATIAHEQTTKRLAAAQVAARGSVFSLLGVLGGPVGFAVMAGLAATAFLDMGNSAKTAALDVDALKGSLEKAVEAFAKMETLERKQNLKALADEQKKQADKVRESALSVIGALPVRSIGLDAVADFVHMERMAQQLRDRLSDTSLSANELQRELEALVQEWVAQGKVAKDVGDKYADAAMGMVRAQNESNQLGARLAVLRAEQDKQEESAKGAATGVSTLNAALAQTNEAAKSYLERMSDRALLAGLKTQREQLEALVKAGKLVFSPEDLKRAREWADTVDRANAASKTKKDPGADYVQSLKERIALLGQNTEYEQLLARVRAGALDLGAHKEVALQKAKELDQLQQQIETERVLKDLRDQQATTQMQYMRELAAFGEGENIRALNADLAKTEDHYRRLIEARRNSAHGLSDTELAQIQASLQEELAMVRQFHDDKLVIQQDWTLGVVKALKDYADEAQKLYDQVGNVVKNAFKGMEDALVEFVRTGKMDFKSLADSIIQDMIRIAVQQSITGPLARAFGSVIGSAFGAGAAGVSQVGSVGSGAGGMSASSWMPSKWSSGGYTGDGGRFEPAGIVHRGEGVLNQDEIRALGGEAGFNALRRAIRGPGHAAGGMAGRPVLPPSSTAGQPQITVNVHGAPGQPEVSARRDQQGNLNIDLIFKQIIGRIAGEVQGGQGPVPRAFERKYGLTPQLG